MVSQELQKLYSLIPEVQLYYVINTLGGRLFWLQHDLADGIHQTSPEIESELVDLQERIEFAVQQTTRFGVSQPMLEDKTASTEYRQWLESWDNFTHHLRVETEARIFEYFNRIFECLNANQTEMMEALIVELQKYLPANFPCYRVV